MKFENSSAKYHDFHELYTKHLNPNEMNKEHIKAINSKSKFILKPDYHSYKCIAEYCIKNKKFEKEFDEILDLRDIALLRKKEQKDDKYFSTCDNFSKNINEIQEILDILNNIYSSGYIEKIIYEINIINDKSQENLENIIKELNEIKEEQNRLIRDVYRKNPITRLIYGKQFEIIYQNCLKKPNVIYPVNNILMKYITNNHNKNNVEAIKIENEKINLEEMYENVIKYLNELYKLNNINTDKVYENAFLRDKSLKGIYSFSSTLEKIENDIISCSFQLTDKFPISQTVLYCNSAISEEEIISFIYRSVLCESNILFILVNPEVLDIEKKKLLIQLLKELYQTNPLKMNSLLLFIYAKENKNKEVIIEIEKLPNHKNFVLKDNKRYKYIKFPDVEIYSSEFSGLGKSNLIKEQFQNELVNRFSYEYIYFPINGNISRSEIIKRLLSINNKKIALHLDLNEINNIELVREFLFSFLILKYYSEKENIFYYGGEIKIKVEIPNGFIDYFNLFPVLNFFKHNILKQNQMPKLIVSNKINSNIQILCNY